MRFWGLEVTRARKEASELRSVESVSDKDMLGLGWLINAYKTASGMSVSDNSMMEVSAVWCAIRYISEGIAALPIQVVQHDGKKKKEAIGHPVHALFVRRPHPLYTWFDFWQAIISNACLGDGYARIHFDNSGRPVRLEHLPRSIVHPKIMSDGTLVYDVNGCPTPGVQSNYYINQTFFAHEIIHIKGVTLDGVMGEKVALKHRTNISGALAAQQFSDQYFGNAAHPSGYFTKPSPLTNDQYKRYQGKLQSAYGGVANAGKVMLLDDGLQFHAMQQTIQEAGLMDFRRLTVEEVSRIFKVPQHLLSQLARSTFSNMEQQSAEFLQYTMFPWAEKVEQELRTKLFWDTELGLYSIQFDFSSLQKADSEARAKYYSSMIQSGVMMPDEAREKEGLNPAPGGNRLYMQVNMAPIEQLTQQQQPVPQA